MRLPQRDIHNHLLPGVDDGFQSEGDSLEAISLMSAGGMGQFVFTPHLNPEVYPDSDEEFLRVRYNEFHSKIPSEWGVTTHLAAEYMIVPGFENRIDHQDTLLRQPGGELLIEMSYLYRSNNLEETVFRLNLNGIRPILAHPERYLYMSGELKDFERLRDMGCALQLNLMSLTGCYGEESRSIMYYLLENNFYDFCATDLHGLGQLKQIMDFDEKSLEAGRLEKFFGGGRKAAKRLENLQKLL